ncbi:MAG: anti-sigma factor [Acidobacteriota bacterium]|nr:anti-sigma factor [Acidobacteriota bacterium]
MTCEELRQDYGAYALGVSGDPERIEISEHLSRNCPVCAPGVRRSLETVAALSGGVKIVDPPARLRARVIALVQPAGQKRNWTAILIPWAVAVTLAIAFVAVRPARDTSKMDAALSILNDPETKDVSFGVPSAKGRVFVSPGKGVVFMAANLPAIASGKTFELWVIPASGKPIPAGTFRSQPDASAIYVRPGPVTNAAAVAVTVEPEGGSPQPTTTPFIVSKL